MWLDKNPSETRGAFEDLKRFCFFRSLSRTFFPVLRVSFLKRVFNLFKSTFDFLDSPEHVD